MSSGQILATTQPTSRRGRKGEGRPKEFAASTAAVAKIATLAGANASHGLRRTNEDKRRAVTVLLTDSEWAKWADREIARRCGVDHRFVASVKSSLGTVPSDERTYTPEDRQADNHEHRQHRQATGRAARTNRSPPKQRASQADEADNSYAASRPFSAKPNVSTIS